jgi:hypothetical protein
MKTNRLMLLKEITLFLFRITIKTHYVSKMSSYLMLKHVVHIVTTIF